MPKKSLGTDIEIRRRNEHLIKFWTEYILLLMISFVGVYFIMPKSQNQKIGFAIMASLLGTFLCFCWYMYYHKKTSEMIKALHK